MKCPLRLLEDKVVIRGVARGESIGDGAMLKCERRAYVTNNRPNPYW